MKKQMYKYHLVILDYFLNEIEGDVKFEIEVMKNPKEYAMKLSN